MDNPKIQNIINSFITIPSTDIDTFLSDNNIQISADPNVNYQNAMNLIFTATECNQLQLL